MVYTFGANPFAREVARALEDEQVWLAGREVPRTTAANARGHRLKSEFRSTVA